MAIHPAARARFCEAKRVRDRQYDDYLDYRAEQRACGYEVESFEEWLGEDPRKARRDAEFRLAMEGERY